MALSIKGRMKVKTLKVDFKEEFGLTLRVYDGRSFADDNATLAAIRKNDNKGGEFSPKRNTKVGNLEDKIMDIFGIKTQVAGSDDSYLCNNDFTLAKALEVDEKLMLKRSKKETKHTIDSNTPTEDKGKTHMKTKELTAKEKEWADDIISAPDKAKDNAEIMLEVIRTSYASNFMYASNRLKDDKDFISEVIKEDIDALEYASDRLKEDEDLAYLCIQRANEKNTSNFFESCNSLSDAGLRYFNPKVYENKNIIEAICLVTPIIFWRYISSKRGIEESYLKSFIKYNDLISSSLKDDFDKRLDHAKEILNNTETVSQKIEKIYNVFNCYLYQTLINFDKDFNLTTSDFDEDTFLLPHLSEIIKDEIIEPLQEMLCSYEEIDSLINCSIYDHDSLTLFNYMDKTTNRTTELAEQLVSYVNEADLDAIITTLNRGSEDWSFKDDCEEEYNELLATVETKVGDGEFTYTDIIEIGDEYGSEFVLNFSDTFKEKLLSFINEMSESEREEFYCIDEIIESLEE